MSPPPKGVCFDSHGWEDYLPWQDDPKKRKRINQLIDNTLRTPFEGIGKPEPLKGDLQGFWSRRIDEEHRLVYGVADEQLIVIQCRYHY